MRLKSDPNKALFGNALEGGGLGTGVGDVSALGDGFTGTLAIKLPTCRERKKRK
jgi:hypothetical protein